jgi:hypothetical protein
MPPLSVTDRFREKGKCRVLELALLTGVGELCSDLERQGLTDLRLRDVGEVEIRGLGFGAGRGWVYLSAGFRVSCPKPLDQLWHLWCSDSVSIGTSSMLVG